jgi:hypothetical protein
VFGSAMPREHTVTDQALSHILTDDKEHLAGATLIRLLLRMATSTFRYRSQNLPQRNGKTYSWNFVYDVPTWTITGEWNATGGSPIAYSFVNPCGYPRFSVGLVDVRFRETKGYVRPVPFKRIERGIVKFDSAVRHVSIVLQNSR